MATLIKGKNARKPWTVRYYHDHKQRETSFITAREARAFMAKFEHDSRAQIFVDPRTANTPFGDVALDWLARHTGTPKTKSNYEMALRLHILPEFGGRGLASVANDRIGVEVFLSSTLPGKGLGVSMVRTCYQVIGAIVNDAIRTGKLNQHRLRGIHLPVAMQKAEIVFATHEQIGVMAEAMPSPYGFTLYLMRGCGLRLGESLGWRWGDFSENGLRLSRQLSPSGIAYIPLKHRNEGEYRDIPVPLYIYDHRPGGVLEFPRVSHRQYRDWFNKGRDKAGLPESFTPHTLRHIFASVCLAGGIPITEVSQWLGHRSIQVTYGIYGHLVPASWERARGVLDEEWSA